MPADRNPPSLTTSELRKDLGSRKELAARVKKSVKNAWEVAPTQAAGYTWGKDKLGFRVDPLDGPASSAYLPTPAPEVSSLCVWNIWSYYNKRFPIKETFHSLLNVALLKHHPLPPASTFLLLSPNPQKPLGTGL